MITKIIYTLCIALCAITGFAQPNVEFDTKKVDFGTILEGTVNPFRFHYKNIGNQPFLISYVSVTCGCTAPVWSKKELQPGDTASIYIEFNSANKNGPVVKGVNIINNSTEPLIGLLVYANIVPDSNFKVIVDSVSFKPFKLAYYKSYNQVMIPLKILNKKGFNGTISEAEMVVKRIIKDSDHTLYENLWTSYENNIILVNALDKKLQEQSAILFKKEILKKKRLKYWMKKIKE